MKTVVIRECGFHQITVSAPVVRVQRVERGMDPPGEPVQEFVIREADFDRMNRELCGLRDCSCRSAIAGYLDAGDGLVAIRAGEVCDV